jgi:hypothetical protein
MEPKPAQPTALPKPVTQQAADNTSLPFDKQGTAPMKQCGNAWPFDPGPAPLPGGKPFILK